jgi:hypothetical protein
MRTNIPSMSCAIVSVICNRYLLLRVGGPTVVVCCKVISRFRTLVFICISLYTLRYAIRADASDTIIIFHCIYSSSKVHLYKYIDPRDHL